jgi:hypothetical protein
MEVILFIINDVHYSFLIIMMIVDLFSMLKFFVYACVFALLFLVTL